MEEDAGVGDVVMDGIGIGDYIGVTSGNRGNKSQ